MSLSNTQLHFSLKMNTKKLNYIKVTVIMAYSKNFIINFLELGKLFPGTVAIFFVELQKSETPTAVGHSRIATRHPQNEWTTLFGQTIRSQ